MPRHKWDPTCPPPRGLVRPVRLDPAGTTGPTRDQAKRSKWRRTSHGHYVPATVDSARPEQRVLEQSVRLSAAGAVTGWASLRLHGGSFFDGLAPDGRTRMPVPLAIGRRSKIRGDDDVALSREPLGPEEVVTLHGIRCTKVRRALFDEMRRLGDVRAAVVAMDMAAAALLVSVRRMRAYRADRRAWRRSTVVRDALELASEDSRSPNESRLRLIWQLDGRFPQPSVNQPVWNLRGQLLGIADLLDVEAGLVGEYDGADHREASRHTRDIERQERFERHGLQVCRVTGLDVLSPERIVERIRFHRSRALWQPPRDRTWTTEPPAGRCPEQSLDEYLDERDLLRALHEEHERNPPDLRDLRGW